MAIEFLVQGMSCPHCVQTISVAVNRIPGTTDVHVDLKRGVVTVSGTPDRRTVAAAIEDSGYDVELSSAAADIA